jgi:hypothetical protein
MRTLLPLLLFLLVGCNHCSRLIGGDSCAAEVEDCKPPRGTRHLPVAEAPCPTPAPKDCLQTPEIEVQASKPIHVKLQPQKIILQNEAQPQQMMQPQSVAPQQMMQPQSFAPQSGAPQQVMMMPVMQPQSAAPAGGARPGLTIDFFRLPIPFPKLIAVPDAAPQMQAVAMVAPQSYAPQAYAPQSYAPQAFAPQSFVPQAAPQQHVMVPVPGTVDVPVQTMMKVPYQAHVPVPVQPQSFAPHSVAVQPQSVAVQPQGMIPIVPHGAVCPPQAGAAPQMQGITLQQAEEFCRLVEQMKKQMNERK